MNIVKRINKDKLRNVLVRIGRNKFRQNVLFGPLDRDDIEEIEAFLLNLEELMEVKDYEELQVPDDVSKAMQEVREIKANCRDARVMRILEQYLRFLFHQKTYEEKMDLLKMLSSRTLAGHEVVASVKNLERELEHIEQCINQLMENSLADKQDRGSGVFGPKHTADCVITRLQNYRALLVNRKSEMYDIISKDNIGPHYLVEASLIEKQRKEAAARRGPSYIRRNGEGGFGSPPQDPSILRPFLGSHPPVHFSSADVELAKQN